MGSGVDPLPDAAVVVVVVVVAVVVVVVIALVVVEIVVVGIMHGVVLQQQSRCPLNMSVHVEFTPVEAV